MPPQLEFKDVEVLGDDRLHLSDPLQGHQNVTHSTGDILEENSKRGEVLDVVWLRRGKFGDELYEDLMEREHENAKQKARQLIKVLADLIQSLSDEI